MDKDVFEVKAKRGQHFSTDEEIRASLREAAGKPYNIKDNITFAEDKWRNMLGLPLDDTSKSTAKAHIANLEAPPTPPSNSQNIMPFTVPQPQSPALQTAATPEAASPLYKSETARAAALREAAGKPYNIKDNTTFVEDKWRNMPGFPLDDASKPTAKADTVNLEAPPTAPGASNSISADRSPLFSSAGESAAASAAPISRAETYRDNLDVRRPRKSSGRLRQGMRTAERLLPTYGDPYYGDAARIDGARVLSAKAELATVAVAEFGKTGIHTASAIHRGYQDWRGGTMTAKQALSVGKDIFLKDVKSGSKNFGKHLFGAVKDNAVAFDPQTEDFASAVPGQVKNAAVDTYRVTRSIVRAPKSMKTAVTGLAHGAQGVARLVATIPKPLLLFAGAALLLTLLAVAVMQGGAAATVPLYTLCANDADDIATLVTALNDYRDTSLTGELYNAFRADTDPNGNPYGYSTLTGRKSNNLTHGVTWHYANGISNDTAEIISMAAVYFQQNWPASDTFSDVGGSTEPFLLYCKNLAAYGLDVTAQESAPYTCLPYGGCVNGYRSDGEAIEITNYRQSTHICEVGAKECGSGWEWSGGHGEGQQHPEWVEDGVREVTVYFPVVLPDGANATELTILPEGATEVSGVVAADSMGTNLVLTDYNLYRGVPDNWFFEPGEVTGSFSVTYGEGDYAVTDSYEVIFQSATAVPWCPGELNDGQYGHYDLDITLYMVGYNDYHDPETAAPDGSTGGSGNLQALAAATNGGTLTRTVLKKNQHGDTYTTNQTATRYTQTIALPQNSAFSSWYENGQDTYGNVAWAELLYKMDWDSLYGVSDGIKCKTIGRGLSDAELAEILAALGVSGDDARAQVAAFAIACQGQFAYRMGGKPSGGPGNVSVGAALDCSGFIRYCYWSVGLPFAALNTGDYGNAGDLVEISAGSVQPGDVRVVYASGGVSGHVQMYVGGGSWIECCSGYGVALNMSNGWMESRPCHYFTYVGF